MRKVFLLVLIITITLSYLGCEKSERINKLANKDGEEADAGTVESKIEAIIESYLKSDDIVNYTDLLVEKAKEIEQHGNVAKNILLKRIGTDPKEDILLVEAYFQIVGTSKQVLIHAVHCLNNVLSHHAAFRFRCKYDQEYIFGEKYLDVLASSLEDKSVFCCEKCPEGIPIWLYASNEIEKLVNIDFGFDESSVKSSTLAERLDILQSWFKLILPYYYSKEYEQPKTPKEFRTYHLDKEAMNANIPTREYRRMKEHRWLSPNNSDGYGSPYYDEECFENWSMFKSQFSTYTIDAFQLKEFENPRKK